LLQSSPVASTGLAVSSSLTVPSGFTVVDGTESSDFVGSGRQGFHHVTFFQMN